MKKLKGLPFTQVHSIFETLHLFNLGVYTFKMGVTLVTYKSCMEADNS